MTLNDYKTLIESKLDIKDTMIIEQGKIVPNTSLVSKKYIKEHFIDDLFEYHIGKLVFKSRLMHLVSEITDRQVLVGHYSMCLRT